MIGGGHGLEFGKTWEKEIRAKETGNRSALKKRFGLPKRHDRESTRQWDKRGNWGTLGGGEQKETKITSSDCGSADEISGKLEEKKEFANREIAKHEKVLNHGGQKRRDKGRR